MTIPVLNRRIGPKLSLERFSADDSCGTATPTKLLNLGIRPASIGTPARHETMTKDPDPLDPNPEPANDLGETAYMVQQARAGDREAMNDLINRYKKPLERFMHARLSPAAHRVHDTQDGTQDVLIAAYSAVMSGRFQYRGLGSFWFYLRTSARNYIIKKNQRAGEKKMLELSEESGLAPAAAGEPPIASMIELEQMLQYERALETVPEDQRNAFLLFHEVGMSHANIAEECGFPSADAARMCIARVRAKVAIEMGRDDSKDARNKNSR